MEEKDFKKITLTLLIVGLLILSFIMIKPIAGAIALGLVLSYLFRPLYTKLAKKIKSPNWAAFLIVGGILFLIILPFIFLIPLVARQVVDAYVLLKDKDIYPIILKIIPSIADSPRIAADLSAITSSFTSNIAGYFLNFFKNWIYDLPNFLLQSVIVVFTFFFVMRDWEKMREYFMTLSPFPKEYQNKLVEKFKQITNAVLYGQVIVGISQGLVAGIGYLIFGVHNALLFTLLTIVSATLPIVGAWFVWLPIDAYLFLTDQTTAAVGLLVYCLLIVSLIDNFLRMYIMAKVAKLNTGLVLIGMIGGLYVFGILGLILGPLILSYVLLLAEFYRDKNFKSILIQEHPTEEKASA